MKNTFVLLGILLGWSLYPVMAQPGNDTSGILRVHGKAETRVSPDEAVIHFSLESKALEYDHTVNSLGEKADDLERTLSKLGFEENRIKTVSFNVSRNYVYRNNQRQDSGYVARQSLSVEFPYEREKVIRLINGVSGSLADPSLSFNFRLSKSRIKEVNHDLMAMAVKDARTRADILAASAGVMITGISEINDNASLEPGPQMYRMRETDASDEPGFGGFNVEDLSITRTVEVIYRIDMKD